MLPVQVPLWQLSVCLQALPAISAPAAVPKEDEAGPAGVCNIDLKQLEAFIAGKTPTQAVPEAKAAAAKGEKTAKPARKSRHKAEKAEEAQAQVNCAPASVATHDGGEQPLRVPTAKPLG